MLRISATKVKSLNESCDFRPVSRHHDESANNRTYNIQRTIAKPISLRNYYQQENECTINYSQMAFSLNAGLQMNSSRIENSGNAPQKSLRVSSSLNFVPSNNIQHSLLLKNIRNYNYSLLNALHGNNPCNTYSLNHKGYDSSFQTRSAFDVV